ncbi:hypothetical protein M432DRAFT_252273 [Thermoascus aurantiacus ATCC 26904]
MEKEKGDITPETFTPQVGMESIKAYVLECAHFPEKQLPLPSHVDSRCQARLSLNHDELWARRAYLICHVLLSIYTYPICSPSDDHYLGYTKSSDVSGGIPFSLFGTISVSFPFLFR